MRLASLAVLAGPLFGYPLYAGALAATDALLGERLFEYHVRFEQRLLLDSFLADYRASLPIAVALAAALVAIGVLARRWGGYAAAFAALTLSGAAAGVAGALTLSGGLGSSGLALGIAGACYGALLALLGRPWFVRRVHPTPP